MNENPSLHVISSELLQKVLDYLVTKPYNEVGHLVNEITTNAALVPQQTSAPVEQTENKA